jgi:hypothetical protein
VEDWQLAYVIESEPFPKKVITRTISKRGSYISDASKELYIRRKWFPIAVQYQGDSRKGTLFQDAGNEVPIRCSY